MSLQVFIVILLIGGVFVNFGDCFLQPRSSTLGWKTHMQFKKLSIPRLPQSELHVQPGPTVMSIISAVYEQPPSKFKSTMYYVDKFFCLVNDYNVEYEGLQRISTYAILFVLTVVLRLLYNIINPFFKIRGIRYFDPTVAEDIDEEIPYSDIVHDEKKEKKKDKNNQKKSKSNSSPSDNSDDNDTDSKRKKPRK